MRQLDWKAHRALKGSVGFELHPENVKRKRGHTGDRRGPWILRRLWTTEALQAYPREARV